MRYHPKQFGFTLIEIVLVIALVAFVAGSTTMMLVSVGAGAKRVRRETNVQEQARNALDAIATAARNAIRFKQRDEWQLIGMDDEWELGEQDSITFFTTSYQAVRQENAESDVKEVAFRLLTPDDSVDESQEKTLTSIETEDNTKLGLLIRRTDPTRGYEPDDGGVEEVIAHGIAKFNVSYFDGLEWVDSWEEELAAQYPQLLRVTVEARDVSGKGRSVSLSRIINLPWLPQLEATQSKENDENTTQQMGGRG
ncbi:prepilin-type N-terminal cleavage/methylation domain-containing protein [Poriferisphaera sp. WC338]|uniref:prepilin-type N-terminal cleavage/methylation domain-containing protein n=1 Tax=Poriferisphaera sp. WC338 TaxID=3425129 RepID=UPI003D81A135